MTEQDTLNKAWSLETWFARVQPSRSSFPPRLGVTLGAALLAFLLSFLPVVSTLDFICYQLALRSFSGSADDQPVSLVLEVGEKTAHEFGPWPWTNAQLADTITFFSKQNVSAIYIDASLKATSRDADEYLEKALMRHGQNVFIRGGRDFSIPRFSVQVRGHGQIETGKRIDGVVREWRPALENEKVTSGLSAPLQILMDVFPESFKKIESRLNMQSMLIPWSTELLNQIQTEEYSEWLHDALELDPKISVSSRFDLSGRVVWIGSASANLEMNDLHEPVSRVRLAAMLFEQMRRGRADSSFPKWMEFGVLLIWVVAFFAFCRRRGWFFWLGAALTMVAAPVFAYGMYGILRIFLSPVTPLIFGVIAVLGLLIEDLLHSEKEKKIFFYLATRDGLTNLYGIRHFRLIMNQLTHESSERREKLALILLDIDYFKKINDTFGHPAGDEVIKKTAETLVAVVRQKRPVQDIDFIARYGGEEFMVLIRKTNLKTTAEVAERIREAVENSYFEWNDLRIYVTVSIGVAVLREDENVPDAMVHRADQALYKAKNQGRNRVCFDEEE